MLTIYLLDYFKPSQQNNKIKSKLTAHLLRILNVLEIPNQLKIRII
jgi:hypothetical protein